MLQNSYFFLNKVSIKMYMYKRMYKTYVQSTEEQ